MSLMQPFRTSEKVVLGRRLTKKSSAMNELPFRPDDTSLIEDEIDCVIDSGIERGATLFEEMREFIEARTVSTATQL
jgi:hypothetical protein